MVKHLIPRPKSLDNLMPKSRNDESLSLHNDVFLNAGYQKYVRVRGKKSREEIAKKQQ